jgi:hypothetical protein
MKNLKMRNLSLLFLIPLTGCHVFTMNQKGFDYIFERSVEEQKNYINTLVSINELLKKNQAEYAQCFLDSILRESLRISNSDREQFKQFDLISKKSRTKIINMEDSIIKPLEITIAR